MTATNIPHALVALSKVFKNLAVAKDGTLPGNMGGKSYMSAEAVSNAVRDEFAANDLMLLSNEDEIARETLIHKDRVTTSSSIKGTYTLVSLVDASTLTISGIGHGLATGTAVAANIASTFALKNAFLRTFLASEQSSEDQGLGNDKGKTTEKEEPKATENRATRNVERTQKATARKKLPAAETKAQAKVKEEFIDTGLITPEHANARRNHFQNQGSEKPLQDLLAELNSGDLGNV